MKNKLFISSLAVSVSLLSLINTAVAEPADQPTGKAPLYTLNIQAASTKVISYRNLSGSTKIDFRGTPLSPETKGEAVIKNLQGSIQIDAKFTKLQAANKFGGEYLTYVLWSISPEGRATNLGELLIKGDQSRIRVTTQLQAFGLIVTAEPYFAVTQVGNVVVAENSARKDTKGQVDEMDAKFDLLQRGQYSLNRSPADLQPAKMDKKIPFYIYQARNAVNIAKASNAETLAPDTYKKAQDLLTQAQDRLIKKRRDRKVAPSIAREAVQTAEDARLIALKRSSENEVNSKLSEAEAARNLATSQADTARADALKANELAQLAQADAAKANAMAAEAEKDKTALREQLRKQLNEVLATRDSARGLIVNMSDVLFTTGKYDLKAPVREKLAKVAGIIMSHPGLKLSVEGHTDNVGSEAYNQTLSERRAEAVRGYLVSQGIQSEAVVGKGFGKTNPIADNSTAEGRAQNRRVEIVVSGATIGDQARAPQ